MLPKFFIRSLLVIFISLLSFASVTDIVDPFNTYQFNRINYEQNTGLVSHSPWFEWWYYKVVIPEKQKAYYFVYGVVNPWDKQNTMAGTSTYVDMGSFSDKLIIKKQFKLNEFKAAYDTTYVQVASDNIATQRSLKGTLINDKGESTAWNIAINKKWGFNATSWATGKNITKIEWYPAQADALCSGEIIVNGETEIFKNAPCYQDRNWGSELPDWWAWVVSNHFENSPDTSLVVGGGRPTINKTGKKVDAFSIGFKHAGKEYSWRPIDGDLISFDIQFGKWEILGTNKNYQIKITASAPRDKFMDLQFMSPEGRIFHDYEALQGDLKVQLYKKGDASNPFWQLNGEFNSHQAGLEYGSFNEL
jgi:tocopherol cyclase